jgi:hypothetical protein
MKRKLKEIMVQLPKEHLIECIESFGYLEIVKSAIQREIKGGRKNVDYQWSEYIVYLVCKGGSKINTFEELETTFDLSIEKGYLRDLLDADKKKVMKYYNTFYDAFEKLGLHVSKVYLMGKNQSKFTEIKKLHEVKDAKLKADIIVLLNDDSFVGFSVKSCEQDTLTNYSIYKMLPKDEVNMLKEIQLSIIERNGLSTDKEYYRKNREKYNKLFANSSTIDNEYHITLNEYILEHRESILEQWYKNLFGKLPYELFTFNGTTLTSDNPSPEFINIKSIQNPAKKDNTQAAKLFYALYDDDKILYKWEIRWKGDIFVSPQILTFKWNPEKDHLKLIKAIK